MLGVSSSSTTNTPLTADSTDTGSVVKNGDGSTVVTSPGGDVVGTHSNPLPAVAIPVAALPDYVAVSANLPDSGAIWSDGIASTGAWTAQIVETGRAIIDLDGNYRLSINDVLAEVILENLTTNVTTRIWGNAQVEVAGHQIGQFWGTSSFELANGTLITANTIVSPDNSSAFMLDRLVITRDDRGFVVEGISSEIVGDLAITYAANAAVYEHLPAAESQVSVATSAAASVLAPDVAPESQAAIVAETVSEAVIKAPVAAAENIATKVVEPAEPIKSVEAIKPVEAAAAGAVGQTKEKQLAAAAIEMPAAPGKDTPAAAAIETPASGPVPKSEPIAPVSVAPVNTVIANPAPVVAAPVVAATPDPVLTSPSPVTPQPITAPITVASPEPAIVSTTVVTAPAAPTTPIVTQPIIVPVPAPAPVSASTPAPAPISAPAPVKAPVLVENIAANIAAIRARIDGYDMDDDQRDGLVFVETATGWIDEWDDKKISADVLAQTMVGAEFGPDSTIMSRSEFGAVISRFISILTTQGMMSQIANSNSISQSQLRDSAMDSDRQASARQASERAARDRRIMLNMIDGGVGANALLDRSKGNSAPL